MSPTYLLAKNSLTSIFRNRFFWFWNAGILILISILNLVTFFDFVDGPQSAELFLTTLTLSGAVNSMVFHLGAVKDLSRRNWDLLVIRPVKPSSIVIGRFIALVAFQVTIGLLLLAGFLLQSRLLHHGIPESLWKGWSIAILQIAMLSALYGLIAIWLIEFWAIVAMVGVFLLGHLSTHICLAVPRGWSFLASLLYCVVPDLDLSDPLGKSPVPIKLSSEVAWGGFYVISYIILIIYISSVSIRPALDRK